MRNITVSVPDDVYRAARIAAAEEGTSVSAMVGGYLRSLTRRNADFLRLEQQQNAAFARVARRGGLNMSENLTRDEVNDRALTGKLSPRDALH